MFIKIANHKLLLSYFKIASQLYFMRTKNLKIIETIGGSVTVVQVFS